MQEKNENECANFILHMSQYLPNQLVFSDESVYDRRTLSCRYGWNISRHCARKPTFFVRG